MTTELTPDRRLPQMNGVSRSTHQVSTSFDKQLLPAAVKGSALLPTLERLCSAKRALVLTPHQAETWLASLSVFDPQIVTEVMIRVAHSDDSFPDLGKIVMACEKIRRERAGSLGQGEVQLSSNTLKALAASWGVSI
jgi:hypothetical protein